MKSRSALLLILPLFDLAVTAYFGFVSASASTEVGLVGHLLGFSYHVFTWLLLFLSIGLFLGISAKRSSFLLTRLSETALVMLLLPLFAYLIFNWVFLFGNGFAPSADAISFLIANLERLPQHILQTSPMVAVALFLGSLLLALLTLFLFRPLNPVWNSGNGYRQLGLWGVTLLAWLMTAPHVFLVTPLQAAIAKVASPSMEPVGSAGSHGLKASQPYVTVDLTATQRHPVIVVLIESLRRDLLEISPSPIPFLKSLVDESIFFDRAYATASHSNYADLAFWYAQYPLRKLSLQRYPKDAAWRGDSLFSAFKAHDFTTAYISSQNEKWGQMINWLDVEEVDYFYDSEDFEGETWLNEDDRFGIKMLMQKGVATAGKIEDSATLKIAERWIDSLQGREDFFLGLNLQNTHFSYVIPPGGAEPFQPAELDFEAVYFRWPETKKEQVRNRYLNAVYNVDRLLQQFAGFLKKRGLWEKSTLVIVGDSGEAFYEHGFGNHSGPMYDEVMRTFALIKPPGSSNRSTGTVRVPVSHIDIAAAVLDIPGIPVPDSFQGVSPLKPERNERVFMHTNAIVKQNALVDWPWKLMHTYYPKDFVELYDLQSDTAERVNLAQTKPEITARLDAVLSNWITRQVLYYSQPEFYTGFAPPKTVN